ncbi:MAG: hypothetical protein DI539_26310 [Flavobacterium psychrophilum]|nr:MAG: hypothetical protein DI539_26310 [Flavobacterium psychrophilum]
MSKPIKHKSKKEKIRSRTFTEVINAWVGVIGIVLAAIAVFPTITNYIEKPKITITYTYIR